MPGSEGADEQQQVGKKKFQALTVRAQTDTERSTLTSRPCTPSRLLSFHGLMTNQGSKLRYIYPQYPAGSLRSVYSWKQRTLTVYDTLSFTRFNYEFKAQCDPSG